MSLLILASEYASFFLPPDRVQQFRFIWDLDHVESIRNDPGAKRVRMVVRRKVKTMDSSAVFLSRIFSTCAQNRKSKQLFSNCLCIKYTDD